MERKVLSYIQLRKGPNKVGWWGIIQSFSDAIKLFIKEQYFPIKSNLIVFYISPIFSLFVSLIIWISFPQKQVIISLLYRRLFFFCCSRLNVYRLIGSGWSSNSNYSLIGSLRGIAQTVSYEVSLILVFIVFLIYGSQFNFIKLINVQYFFFNLFIFFPLFYLWFISSLAETNRTPFDFSEGESELVSGFNIEYGRGGFALIFLREYSRIIFIRFLISLIFFGGNRLFIVYLISIFWVFTFIWVRSCYPRFRYDKLMDLSWKNFLPSSLFLLFYYILLI